MLQRGSPQPDANSQSQLREGASGRQISDLCVQDVPSSHWRNQQERAEEDIRGSETGICRAGRFTDRSLLQSDVLFLCEKSGGYLAHSAALPFFCAVHK